MIHSPTTVVSLIPSGLRNTDWEKLGSGVAEKLLKGWKLLNINPQLVIRP